MKIISLTLLTVIAAMPAVVSCSSKTDNAVTYDVTAQYADSAESRPEPKAAVKKNSDLISSENANTTSAPYRLGREQAMKLHQCGSTSEQRDLLLDINARLTNIRNRIGEEAANDFLHGMRDHLSELGDTLAVSLF